MVKYVMNLDLVFLAFEKETFLDFQEDLST
jgi:hypothetical protein